jgi:hypothetical protein
MDISTYVRLVEPLKKGFWWQFPSSPCGIGWTRAVTHWVADDGRAAGEWRSADEVVGCGEQAEMARARTTSNAGAQNDCCSLAGWKTSVPAMTTTSRYWVIEKERPDSPHRIDAAMAGCPSWEARTLSRLVAELRAQCL